MDNQRVAAELVRLAKKLTAGGKVFNTQYGIGKSKYVVNFHDGKKTHKDGSPFFDIKIFKNKKDFEAFQAELRKKGYKEGKRAAELTGGKRVAKYLLQKQVSDLNKAYWDMRRALSYIEDTLREEAESENAAVADDAVAAQTFISMKDKPLRRGFEEIMSKLEAYADRMERNAQ